MSDTPLTITCVLVSHRKPRWVHEAVRSVIGQTHPHWQLVVTDSGLLVKELAYQYRGERRIVVVESRDGARCQGWQINNVFRLGLVTGDLVCYMADDDVYFPGAFAAFAEVARANPSQSAWYGRLEVAEAVDKGEVVVSRLDALAVGVGTPDNSLRGKADGMQVCHRASVRARWPEEEDIDSRRWADGIFLDALAALTPIHPIRSIIGRHRRTPESEFTKPGAST